MNKGFFELREFYSPKYESTFIAPDRPLQKPQRLKMNPPGIAVGEAFCSTANLGAGFDVFGLALDKYFDRVRVRISPSRKIRIIPTGPYASQLPRDPERNSAGPPARTLLEKAGQKKGLEITIEKNVPPGWGLGSSGATAAACTKTLDHLLDLKLSNDELVQAASLGEKAAAGTAHPDNVAASLLGGFTIVYDRPLRVVSIRPPSNLEVVVVTPYLAPGRAKTRKARKLLPNKLELRKAVLNIGRASAIAAGFALNDIEMIGTGMKDEIAEPNRESLIPGYREVRKEALHSGASGVAISGAGPSVIALADRTRYDPRKIAKSMLQAFAKDAIASTFFVARPAPGARIIGRK